MGYKIKSWILWLAFASSLAVSSTLLYVALRKKRNPSSELKHNQHSVLTKGIRRISVPRDVIGAIIGRHGSVIGEIQETTNTKIHFENNDEGDDQTVVIKGEPDDMETAIMMIKEVIEDARSVCTEEIFVPTRALNRIIGKQGCAIRQICEKSKALVTVCEKVPGKDHESAVTVIKVRGTVSQINVAVALIDEKITEEEVCQQQLALLSARSGKRDLHHEQLSIEASTLGNSKIKDDHAQGKLVAVAKDGFIEVFVSAVTSPSQFWVQVVHNNSTALDKLATIMTEYYNQECNKQENLVENIAVGDMVVALFSGDQSWYRAKVMSVHENDYSPSETEVEVFYVDFGDTDRHLKRNVRLLKEEFLELPFQALECCLSEVKPKGNSWSTEAIEVFEQLVYVAQWKIIMAQIHSYVTRNEKVVNSVNLVDTNGKEDLTISKELVKLGYAVHL